MTASDWRKMLKQLEKKPAKLKKYMKHNKPKERSCGFSKNKCTRCLRSGGHIKKYGVHLCRMCFRETATELGFKKYS